MTTPLRRVVSSCDAADSPWVKRRLPRGALTPDRMLPSRSVQGKPHVELHGGPFGSRWLRVRHGAVAVEVCELLQSAEAGSTASVWIGVPEDYAEFGPLIGMVRERGYRFHHAVAPGSTEPATEFLYYRWLGEGVDMVPSYTTAHEGVGVLVLSPERDAVLLVWEYGNWKMITGNVDGCGCAVATASREVREECGVELVGDLTLVGGWQHPENYDLRWNNDFYVFVAVAKTRDFHVDEKEITHAKWFPLVSLPSAAAALAAPQLPNMSYGLAWDCGDEARPVLSRLVPRFLETWSQGRGLLVDKSVGRRNLFS